MAQPIYKVVIGFNKISILCLYLRIFVDRSFRILCFINLSVVVAFTTGATFATIFQCVPIAASWDKSVEAECTDSTAFWYAWCIINIVTDVAILALPVREVWQLQLPSREKIGLLAVFSLGALSVPPPC